MKKLIVIGLLLLCAGCVRTIDERGTETFSLVPTAEKTAEAGVDIMAALSPLFPWLGTAALATATALGTYKKMKPKIEEAKSQEQVSHTAAQFLVEFFDDLKENHPEVWEKEILPKVERAQWGRSVENFIRGLRGKQALPEAA